MLKLLKSTGVTLVKQTSVALLILMTALSPVAHALEIKLGEAMRVRIVDGDDLTSVGVLAAGSVVEIPDKYKVKDPKTGRINAAASFNNWLVEAGYDKKDVKRAITDQRKDFYYPVKIKSLAPGSRGANLIGKTRFMALRVLAQSKGKLYVNKNSPVYSAPRLTAPLDARGDLSNQPAAAPARRAPAPEPQAAPAPVAPMDQDDGDDDNDDETDVSPPIPPVNPRAKAGDDADDAEAQSGVREDCPTCNKPTPLADTGAALTTQGYNDEADGMQGLTSQFPKACEAFIKPDGTYGSLGQKVLKNMSGRDAFKSNWTMNAKAQTACPKYNSFNSAERRHFWVYAFAAMEAEESGCDQTVGADPRINPNGVAAGGAQIEEDEDLREGRDRTYGGHFCAGANPYNSDLNIKCGVRMLEDVADNGEGPYSRRNQYWSSYKFDRMKAKALISQYKPCGATPYYKWKNPPLPHRKGRHHHGKHHSKKHTGHRSTT